MEALNPFVTNFITPNQEKRALNNPAMKNKNTSTLLQTIKYSYSVQLNQNKDKDNTLLNVRS